MVDYEELLDGVVPIADAPDPDERTAAAMCYTTGTTGRPKGVLYSHRALVLHTMAISLPSCFGIGERDVLLPVVPMFHANAWGLPFAAAMNGAALVLPGPHLDAASLVELFESERVTLTAGVPTIWMSVLQHLDAHPGKYDLSALHSMVVGGAAIPQALIEAFERRHGLRVIHAWGMTETTPLGTASHRPAGFRRRLGRDEVSASCQTRPASPVRGNPRQERERHRRLGRPDDGRAGGAGTLGRVRVLQPRRLRRPFHRRRLVQDRRRRHHRRARRRSAFRIGRRTSSNRAANGSARSRSNRR